MLIIWQDCRVKVTRSGIVEKPNFWNVKEISKNYRIKTVWIQLSLKLINHFIRECSFKCKLKEKWRGITLKSASWREK